MEAVERHVTNLLLQVAPSISKYLPGCNGQHAQNKGAFTFSEFLNWVNICTKF